MLFLALQFIDAELSRLFTLSSEYQYSISRLIIRSLDKESYERRNQMDEYCNQQNKLFTGKLMVYRHVSVNYSDFRLLLSLFIHWSSYFHLSRRSLNFVKISCHQVISNCITYDIDHYSSDDDYYHQGHAEFCAITRIYSSSDGVSGRKISFSYYRINNDRISIPRMLQYVDVTCPIVSMSSLDRYWSLFKRTDFPMLYDSVVKVYSRTSCIDPILAEQIVNYKLTKECTDIDLLTYFRSLGMYSNRYRFGAEINIVLIYNFIIESYFMCRSRSDTRTYFPFPLDFYDQFRLSGNSVPKSLINDIFGELLMELNSYGHFEFLNLSYSIFSRSKLSGVTSAVKLVNYFGKKINHYVIADYLFRINGHASAGGGDENFRARTGISVYEITGRMKVMDSLSSAMTIAINEIDIAYNFILGYSSSEKLEKVVNSEEEEMPDLTEYPFDVD